MEYNGKEVLEIYAAPRRIIIGAVQEGFRLHIPHKPFVTGYLLALVKDVDGAVRRHGKCAPAEADMMLLLSVCRNKLLNLRKWLAAEYNLSAPDNMTMDELIECVVQKRPKVKLYADTFDAMTDESGARLLYDTKIRPKVREINLSLFTSDDKKDSDIVEELQQLAGKGYIAYKSSAEANKAIRRIRKRLEYKADLHLKKTGNKVKMADGVSIKLVKT